MKLKAIWQENSPYSKLLITVGSILVMTTLFTVIGTAIAAALFGVSVEQMPEFIKDLSNPTAVSIMKIIQSASSVGVFIAPAIFLAIVFSSNPVGYLQLNRRIDGTRSLLVVAIMICAMPFINALVSFNNTMELPAFLKSVEDAMRAAEDRAALITEAFLKMNNINDLLVNLIVVAVLPAIGEELLFRGVLQRLLGEWAKNVNVGVWISAFVFSAMHAQFYGFVPRMLLGALFGYLLVWSGSLWLPILAHFVNNGSAVLFTYLYAMRSIETNPDELGSSGSDLYLVITSVIVCSLMIYQIYRTRINLIFSKN